jgi:hypothetical protein
MKSKLRLEDLSIESFATAASGGAKDGTVMGYDTQWTCNMQGSTCTGGREGLLTFVCETSGCTWHTLPTCNARCGPGETY